MDIADPSNFDRIPGETSLSRLPHLIARLTRGLSHAKRAPTAPGGIRIRLARCCWQITMMWLLIAPPVALLTYSVVGPTYEASSVFRVDLAYCNLGRSLELDRQLQTAFIQAHTNLIKSEKVLEAAVADPTVRLLSSIERSQDPKSDLLRRLKVMFREEEREIRVSVAKRSGAPFAVG